MDIYPNRIPGCHTPRPPQPQFPGLPHSRVRSHNAYDGANVGQFRPFQGPQLYGTDERSPGANSHETRDYGSQTSTNYSPGEPPRMPRIDYNQGHGPWPSPNYPVGLPQEHDVLQNGEDSGSIRSTFQQQDDHMVATSALSLGDALHDSNSQAPAIGFDTVGHATRNSQGGPSGTGRRSSVGSRLHLQTSNLEMTQPSDSRPSAIHMSTSDWQVDPPEAVTAGDWNLPLVSYDWTIGNERYDPAEINRRLAMDPGIPSSTASRAHAIEPWHISQTSYQDVLQYPPALTSQHETRGAQRGTRDRLPFAQDPSMMPYIMPSLDNDLARNAHEPPLGYTKTHLSPTWQPSRKDSSNLLDGKRSNVSDNEVRQPPRITTPRSKRKCRSDSSSPPTQPTNTKRARRRYDSKERAEVSQKRKTGACLDCRKAKRKVCESLQMSLYRCHRAYCSCSAGIRPLGMASPYDISLYRANPLPDLPLTDLPLPDLPLADLRNE